MSMKITSDNAIHSYTENEKIAYVNFVNKLVGKEPYLLDNGYVLIDPNTDQIFSALKDG